MMAKKIIWLLVSVLMVLSLVTASCGTKEEEETKVTEEEGQVVITKKETKEQEEKEVVSEEKEMVELTLTKLDGTVMEKMAEKPKYGGAIVISQIIPPSHFDPFLYMMCGSLFFTNEKLIDGDWTKGPAGTGEFSMNYSFGGRMELMKGWSSESWELPDSETIIFHIRPGVHWWNKPPANGRELTADDVVWTINRYFSLETASYYQNYTIYNNNPTSIKTLDKYTVEIKLKPELQGTLLCEIGARMYMCCPDVTNTYGDQEDWRNAMGTAAWMLTDCVPDVTVTFTKHPDYWQYDPLFPDNKLPYADELKAMFISDRSTLHAAFRTGKVDRCKFITHDEFELFMNQCPQLEYIYTYPDQPNFLCGRMDKPELPFHDIRVRQALNMAINKQEILDEFFEGNGLMLQWPCPPAPEFGPYYISLEEQSAAVQELFVYNPEKAKQLLAEAGYPDGFKTVVQTISSATNIADIVGYLSIIKEYFANVNVDMTIEVLDGSAMSGITNSKTHKEMVMPIIPTSYPWMLYGVAKGNRSNLAMYDDPRVEEAITTISMAIGKNDAEIIRVLREIGQYTLEQTPYIWLPQPVTYSMWWPWLKDCYGINDPGFGSQNRQWIYNWIDQSLKKSMGY